MKKTHFLFLFIVVLLLTGCKRTPPPPTAPLVNYQPQLAIMPLWERQVGKGTNNFYLKLQPVWVGTTVFVASYDGILIAVDTHTGRIIWRDYTRLPFTSGITAYGGMLFIGTDKGDVVAFDQCNGHEVWHVHVCSGVLAPPAVGQGVVVVKSQDSTISAFSLQTGRLLWEHKELTPPNFVLRGGSAPRITRHGVLVGFDSGKLTLFRLRSGAAIWDQQIAAGQGFTEVQHMVDIDANLIVVGDTVYVATYQGKIAAVNLRNGHVIWHQDLSAYAGMVIRDDVLYVSDSNDHVWAFNRHTGRIIWQQAWLFGRHISGPAIVLNSLVVGDKEGYLHWIALRNGMFLARTKLKDAVIARPLVQGNQVIAYTRSGRLSSVAVSR